MNRLNPYAVGSLPYLAWDKGWRAQRNGLPMAANAYVEKFGQLGRYNAWRAGWAAAAADEKEQKKEVAW